MQQPVNIYQPLAMKQVRARARLPPTGPSSASSRGRPPPRSLNQLAAFAGIPTVMGSSTTTPSDALASSKSNLPHITVAILACATTGGSLYGFSLYGSALKHSLRLTQMELGTISSANFLAGLLSWGPGLAVDRFGERCSLATGGVCGAISLFLFYLVATKTVLLPREWLVWTLCALGVFMCLAVNLVTGSVFKLVVSTCSPATKGATVGAAKGYVGLGAGAYAILFEALGRDNDLDCLIMIACFNLMATVVPALLLLPASRERSSSSSDVVDDLGDPHFRTMYLGLTGLGILVVGQSVISLLYQEDSEKEGPDYVQFVLLAMVWMGPIWSLLIHPRLNSTALAMVDEEKPLLVEPIPAPPATGNSSVASLESSSNNNNNANNKKSALTDQADAAIANAITCTITPEQQPRRQFNLYEMLSTVEAWLLCWTCTMLTGGGTLMTNNMGQMAESKQLHENVTPAALALFCAAQALSRVMTGAASDHCLVTYGWPRPVFLLLAAVACALSHVVLAFASHEVPFVIGVALSGIAFGMVWPLVVLTVGDLFGTKHLGANYMFFDGFDSAVGTLIISNCIAETVYDMHIQKEHSDDDTTCYGDACFQTTHFVVAALSTSCILTCLCLLNTKQSKLAYSNVMIPSSVAKNVIPSVTKKA